MRSRIKEFSPISKDQVYLTIKEKKLSFKNCKTSNTTNCLMRRMHTHFSIFISEIFFFKHTKINIASLHSHKKLGIYQNKENYLLFNQSINTNQNN